MKLRFYENYPPNLNGRKSSNVIASKGKFSQKSIGYDSNNRAEKNSTDQQNWLPAWPAETELSSFILIPVVSEWDVEQASVMYPKQDNITGHLEAKMAQHQTLIFTISNNVNMYYIFDIKYEIIVR